MSQGKTEQAKSDLSATGIVKLAEKVQVRLFHTPGLEPFASFWIKDHWETAHVKSAAFEDWLSAMSFHHLGAAPSQRALVEARTVFAGRARYSGREIQVYVRVAGHDGAIYIDLGNKSWEAVRITDKGWDVVPDVPIKFLRTPGMQALSSPVHGGSVDDLRPFLNLVDEDDWKLAVSWLIGALRPAGPFPLLVVEGSHGSAKSTCAKFLRLLVDPNTAPLRAGPTNPRDLAISAGNSWCLGFDNLSSVRPWLADALCRLSTGSGFSTRTLYTDNTEKIFEGMRPVLLNGIDMSIERGDLLDRAITLSLPPISEEVRETEANLIARFEDLRPSILGGLMDAVACGLRRLPDIKPTSLPRMADFATWICAAEPVLGWSEGSFLDAYRRNRRDSNTLALEASPLVEPLARIAERGAWQGTATELQSDLADDGLSNLPSGQGNLPRSPRELSEALRRLAPNLLQVGIVIEFARTHGSNSQRVISIRKACDDATHATPK